MVEIRGKMILVDDNFYYLKISNVNMLFKYSMEFRIF